ncbi:MAG: membrane protein insertion efficiency factor YidD [SAR324 cluster bacterium]|nr:membrane protein insertion efficiency factor YidD [SAR324 cluster bacterium]
MSLLRELNRLLRVPPLFVIWLYQHVVSPFLGPSCIYYPSCSEYAKQALQRHGILWGTYLSVTRIARCHPFHQGGVDEVPESISLKTINHNG